MREKYTPWLIENGLSVITTRSSDTNIQDANGFIRMPIYYKEPPNIGADKSKSAFTKKRTCTANWKIEPLSTYAKLQAKDKLIECWIGISTDEWHRARDSDDPTIINRYPLLEIGFSRDDCVKYLIDHGLDVPSKSSCVFCPFMTIQDIISMANNNKHDLEKAIEIDKSVRDIGHALGYEYYLNSNYISIEEIFSSKTVSNGEQNQNGIVNSICDTGYCFL